MFQSSERKNRKEQIVYKVQEDCDLLPGKHSYTNVCPFPLSNSYSSTSPSMHYYDCFSPCLNALCGSEVASATTGIVFPHRRTTVSSP